MQTLSPQLCWYMVTTVRHTLAIGNAYVYTPNLFALTLQLHLALDFAWQLSYTYSTYFPFPFSTSPVFESFLQSQVQPPR